MYGIDVLVESHSPVEWKLRSEKSIRVSLRLCRPLEILERDERRSMTTQVVRPGLSSPLVYWLGFMLDGMSAVCMSSETETVCYFSWDFSREVVKFPYPVDTLGKCLQGLWETLLNATSVDHVKLYNRLADVFKQRLVDLNQNTEVHAIGVYKTHPFEAKLTWSPEGAKDHVVICTTLGDERNHAISLATHPVMKLHYEMSKRKSV